MFKITRLLEKYTFKTAIMHHWTFFAEKQEVLRHGDFPCEMIYQICMCNQMVTSEIRE